MRIDLWENILHLGYIHPMCYLYKREKEITTSSFSRINIDKLGI